MIPILRSWQLVRFISGLQAEVPSTSTTTPESRLYLKQPRSSLGKVCTSTSSALKSGASERLLAKILVDLSQWLATPDAPAAVIPFRMLFAFVAPEELVVKTASDSF